MTLTAPAPPSVAAGQKLIDQIVSRAGTLYSLPAVAVEVLRLTNNPAVDLGELKTCIERDPALVIKLLRVVNSSLFGLSREVCDLNQALALLGVKPLKLLVLGFSLPEGLFAAAAAEQLAWYWNTTLTRAVAARELSEQMLKESGDDAFLAGLLQDIGALALLSELRQPYARFLADVAANGADLHRLEVASLGIDHTDLSAALLERWNMPRQLVAAISEPRIIAVLARDKEPHYRLARTLHLAELLSQLVGARRLSALPELLEAGQAYFGLTKDRLHEIVGALEPKVQQLAEVLSVDAKTDLAYADILNEAHRRLVDAAESAAGPLAVAMLGSLREAAEDYLTKDRTCVLPTPTLAPTNHGDDDCGAHGVSGGLSPFAAHQCDPCALPVPNVTEADFARELTLAVGSCRSLRQPISVALVAVERPEGCDKKLSTALSQVLDAALRSAELPTPATHVAPTRRVLLLPNYDRHEAVALVSRLVERLRHVTERLTASQHISGAVAAAGVASVALASRNFPPDSLRESAQRCLTAALNANAGGVKSLEIS